MEVEHPGKRGKTKLVNSLQTQEVTPGKDASCKDPALTLQSPPWKITGGGEQAASGQAWRLQSLIRACCFVAF